MTSLKKPPRKATRTKEGILVKFKSETPIVPKVSKLSRLSILVDDSGLVSSKPPSWEENLTLLLPRVSTVSRTPIMLENRNDNTLVHVKSSFDFTAYIGTTARIAGDLEGNVNFITTCFGLSADHIVGRAQKVDFQTGLFRSRQILTRETRDLNKEYSQVDLALVCVPPELVGNIVVPKLPKKLATCPYNCAVIGGVPSCVMDLFVTESVVKRIMENGEVELIEDEKEAVISEVSSKLQGVLSGHSEMIASFGETTLEYRKTATWLCNSWPFWKYG